MEYTHHSNNYYFLNIQESVTTEGSGEGIFECWSGVGGNKNEGTE